MAYANCSNQLNWYVGMVCMYIFEVTRKRRYAHWDIILRFLSQNTKRKCCNFAKETMLGF